MKNKILSIAAILLTTIMGLSCTKAVSKGEPMVKEEPKGEKMLIIYYSHSGITKKVAQQIQKLTGAALYEITPETPYPSEYSEVVDQAKKEINAGYRPPLKGELPSIGAYDVVFIGSPNWWSTIAPPVASLAEKLDFQGKIVAPFFTHGGGGLSNCDRDLKKVVKNGKVSAPLVLRDKRVSDNNSEVAAWLKELNLLK